MQHIHKGKKGEELAAEFLMKRGYSILFRNWRYSHYEIDLIAEKEGRPHFIEVKLRTSQKFGQPEESVNKRKIRDLLKAASEFMAKHRRYTDFRIDIISIRLTEGKEPEFFLIEDVYI